MSEYLGTQRHANAPETRTLRVLPCVKCGDRHTVDVTDILPGSSDPEAVGPELPPTIERVEYSAWYQATCTTPGAAIADWAGFSGSREDSVIAEAVAHVLDTGHETAVERTSSVHYRARLNPSASDDGETVE